MLRYYREVVALDLDIAVAPLKANTFNRCKSAVKMLELGMCGIPIIASYFGPYKEYYDDGAVVDTARDAGDWFDALETFIERKATRAIVAEEHLNQVEQFHTQFFALGAWEAILNAL